MGDFGMAGLGGFLGRRFQKATAEIFAKSNSTDTHTRGRCKIAEIFGTKQDSHQQNLTF